MEIKLLEKNKNQQTSEKWTREIVETGFKKFVAEFGRLPTVIEIDKLEYLPSSRQIQRKFGGVQTFRQSMGYEMISYTRGSIRSEVARNLNNKGRSYELDLQNFLVEIYGEIFVHNEKALIGLDHVTSRNTVNFDFYIYSLSGNFGVDVFHCKDRHSLVGSIIHKQEIYKDFDFTTYLVLYSDQFFQDDINLILNKKINTFPTHLKILHHDEFIKIITNERKPYPKLKDMYETWCKENTN